MMNGFGSGVDLNPGVGILLILLPVVLASAALNKHLRPIGCCVLKEGGTAGCPKTILSYSDE